MSRFRRQLPTSPDDPILVETTMNVGQQLQISNIDIREVRWMDWIPSGRSARVVPSDWCLFQRHAIVMPARMLGRLTVEEWRPLITSSVLFEKKLSKTLRGRAALTALVPLGVLTAVIVASIILLIPWLFYLYLVLVLPAVILSNRFYSPQVKKTRLLADTEAAVLVGKEQFLNVLRKIDTMGLDDVDKMKMGKRVPGAASRPNIYARIENLQGYSSQGFQQFPTN